MTTSYTSLLGLALPVTGELSGTWGDTVNNYITAYLDAAVAGTNTISTDADVTLTKTTNASLSGTSSQYSIILWTAGGTATRTIIAPAASSGSRQFYIVVNKTSSTQAIKLCGTGPTTGVTIYAGSSAICVWNGSDFIKVSGTGGGATGGGDNQIFYENDLTVTTDYTIGATKNAGTFGPVTVDTGVTVTVPSTSTWSIV
jgi:hypothetical protein